MVGTLLDPELDLGDPFLSRLLGVGAEHESPSGSSDFEETRFLSFFGRVGHGRALRNFYHIRQVYCAFAAVVATIVVVTNLVSHVVQHKPTQFPPLDFEICLFVQVSLVNNLTVLFVWVWIVGGVVP